MKKRNFVDTMIAAKDYKKLVTFYRDFVGLEVFEEHGSYTLLRDVEKNQTLCVTDGASARSTSIGIKSTHLETAVSDLERLGGKVLTTWEFPNMKGAHCQDPEGNDLMLWENVHA